MLVQQVVMWYLLLLASLGEAAAHHTGDTGVSGLGHVASLFPWRQDVRTCGWPEGADGQNDSGTFHRSEVTLSNLVTTLTWLAWVLVPSRV